MRMSQRMDGRRDEDSPARGDQRGWSPGGLKGSQADGCAEHCGGRSAGHSAPGVLLTLLPPPPDLLLPHTAEWG